MSISVDHSRVVTAGGSATPAQLTGLEVTTGPVHEYAGFKAGGNYITVEDKQSDTEPSIGIIGTPLAPSPFVVKLDTAMSDTATFDFFLKAPAGYYNGDLQNPALHTALEIPGIGRLFMGLPDDRVSAVLVWEWDNERIGSNGNIKVVLPEVPGPEWLHFVLTWDSARGFCSMYMNGTPVRLADVPLKPWTIPAWDAVHLFPRLFAYAAFVMHAQFTPAEKAVAMAPEILRGRHSGLFGVRDEPVALPVEKLRGERLYSAPLDKPEDVKAWVLDAGKVSFAAGWMNMESEYPDATDVNGGHMTYWCDRVFPESFVAEWENRILQDHIAIVFFAAKGENGDDFFGPGFPERHGEFIHYIKGEIVSYHISYQSGGGRGISNLRKNNRFWLMSTGPAGIPPDDRSIHRIRVIKQKKRIQLHVDGRVIIDFNDDAPERYGPPHKDGRIGFRIMRGGAAAYRDFSVWSLKE